MRRSGAQRATPTRLLLVLALALVTLSGRGAANAIRRSSSFVVPTKGSAHALTLTTYVTDAADLHYATVLAGHAPLEAAAIKSAAQQCADQTSHQADRVDRPHRSDGVVQASTMAIHRAQKLERLLDGLHANTSYDVYFVTEVPNSNGVFGQVLSVTGTTTNPTAPIIQVSSVAAANASATSAVVNLTLSSPGIVHFAFVPSAQDELASFTAEDVVEHNTRGLHAVFLTEPRFGWDSLSTQSTVEDLTPATEYDVLIVTEALGHGAVFSELYREERVVQTHAAAPDVADVVCSPTKGSSSSVDLSLSLQFKQDDLRRATSVTVDRYRYRLHYEVSSETSNGTMISTQRGVFPISMFQSAEELLQGADDALHTYSIGDLDSDTEHDIALRVETVDSHGVFGQRRSIEKCRTHANAPKITKANVQPVNGTVSSLQVEVELERSGNVHYVLTPRSGSQALRKLFQQVGDVGELVHLLQESTDGRQTRTGIIEINERDSTPLVSRAFMIDGLEDNSQYSIVVMPETIGSFGVFGKAFDTLLEAATYENASDVSVISVGPAQGTVTGVDIQVRMTKPADPLFVCWGRLKDEAECDEVVHDDIQQTAQSPQASEFIYRIGNLTEDTEYGVVLYAESYLRNGVRSIATDRKTVRTHRRAPELSLIEAKAVDARVDALRLHIETSEPGKVYYAVIRDPSAEQSDSANFSIDAVTLSAESIISDALLRDSGSNHHVDSQNHARRHVNDNRHVSRPAAQSQPSWSVAKRGQAIIGGRSSDLLIDELDSNCTYYIHVVTETGCGTDASSSSGVYGLPAQLHATTHDVAPSIVKAVAGAAPNRTDSVVITVNVSRPGIIHYLMTDTDFADPATIKQGDDGSEVQPHTLRGSFVIEYDHMALEIKNGTNDTQPMEPMVFARNFTVGNLREATTYHLSLTTETLGSKGVFGEFPAPILVTTHDSPPQFVRSSLLVEPTAGSSTSISIQFRLDRLGEVHYAMFFRGLVRDRTTDAFEIEEQRRIDEQELAAQAHAEANKKKDNTTKTVEFVRIPRWPPPTSTYDLSRLTPRAVKDALFEELSEGVWDNGTISVTRDDIVKMKLTEKKLEKLPPNAIFDVCLVPETAASDGIFASLTCNRVVTHADYSNQSTSFDEIHVKPVRGTKDAVHIELFVSKKLHASDLHSVAESYLSHLEQVTGRVPYFVLVDGHEGRSEFAHNNIAHPSRRHDRSISPFKTAVPGRGNVIAAGILDSITFENDTFVKVEQTVTGLRDNHRYFFFFAYETASSHGVFTAVNPHKHRPNETNSRHSEAPGIEVTTFEKAPRTRRFEAVATYGSTSSITVKMDISCASSEEVILHLVILNEDCPALSTSALLPGAEELHTVETREHPGLSLCDFPLIYRRVEVNMTERSSDSRQHQHNRQSRHYQSHDPMSHSIEEEIIGDKVLQPNTTYQVLIASETYNSGGVVSDKFEVAHVTTSPVAPRFNQLRVQPRKGSTTELLIILELDHPGEVHYMLGKSGNSELNVTSPYNVSAKSLPGQRDSKFHNYDREVVRSRRTIKVEDARQTHVEIVDYLVAGTSYDVYVVAEVADDSGIYGEVISFLDVSTFSTPPMLLAHTAYPTPRRTDSLSVGFRVEEGVPCFVHISVITSSPWELTSQVAPGSDAFGNRLALEDRFVGRSSILVEGASDGADDGWREVNVSVPLPGTNYTIFLVTETRDSDGVFGTVASHHGVRSHREPPVPLNVSVRPTDARVDAVTVDVGLNHDEGCHIHFAVLRHRQRFSRSAITQVGRVDVIGSNTSSFIIDGLQGRTTYDVYLRLETLESGGVISDWTPFPVTATTHGLPAEVLESVECEVSPTCDAIGRQPCSHIANVCGDCLDGFDGEAGSSNAPCRQFDSEKARPSIKISGVRINPRRRRQQPIEAHEEGEPEPSPQLLDIEVPTDMPNEGASANPDGGATVGIEDSPSCPVGATSVARGECECESGYHLNSFGTSCVPSVENPLLAQSIALNYASRAL